MCCCSWLRRAWTCPGAKVGTIGESLVRGVVGEVEPGRARVWIVVGVETAEEVTEGLSTVCGKREMT